MVCVDKFFERLSALENEYIDFWADICRIESPTLHKSGVDAVSRAVAERGRALGCEELWCPQPVAGDAVMLTMNPDAKGKPICLSAHADTVHPIGLFGKEVVTFEDGMMHAPGAVDCKGGFAAALLAMHALRDIGYDARPIKLIVQTDEEVSSITSGGETIRFMERCAEGAEAFLNLEGSKDYSVIVARKGIVRYTVNVSGKAAHSSKCYDGVSAVREAAHKIIEFEKIQDKEGLTFNCGMISGGSADNTVPEECTFTVDIRFSTLDEMREAEEIVARVVGTSYVEGTAATFTKKSSRPPMELCDRNIALADRMNEIYASLGMPVLEKKKGTGGSDAAYMTILGVPTVDSISVDGGYIHSKNEYAFVKTLKEAAMRIGAVILYL